MPGRLRRRHGSGGGDGREEDTGHCLVDVHGVPAGSGAGGGCRHEEEGTGHVRAGCFWCTEASSSASRGWQPFDAATWGARAQPHYAAVCAGTDGACRGGADRVRPGGVSYEQLLDLFWTMHDSTTLNRQGSTSGRSTGRAIFYHSEDQKKAAEASRQEAATGGAWVSRTIVTEIVPGHDLLPCEAYTRTTSRTMRALRTAARSSCRSLQKLGMGEEE